MHPNDTNSSKLKDIFMSEKEKKLNKKIFSIIGKIIIDRNRYFLYDRSNFIKNIFLLN